MKYVTKIQTILTSTKIIGLLVIIICGMIKLVQGKNKILKYMYMYKCLHDFFFYSPILPVKIYHLGPNFQVIELQY
jgi:amino acid transporter